MTDITPPYQDPTQPLDARVEDLLSRMTIDEKVSQTLHASPAIERLGVPAYNWWSVAWTSRSAQEIAASSDPGVARISKSAQELAAGSDRGTEDTPRPAEEIVQVYLRALEASVAVPLSQLVAFRRVLVPAGAAVRVAFEIPARALEVVDEDGRRHLARPLPRVGGRCEPRRAKPGPGCARHGDGGVLGGVKRDRRLPEESMGPIGPIGPMRPIRSFGPFGSFRPFRQFSPCCPCGPFLNSRCAACPTAPPAAAT